MSFIGVFITGAWAIGLEYHALPAKFVFGIWLVFAALAVLDIFESKTTTQEDYDIDEYNKENMLSSMRHQYKSDNDDNDRS